MAAVEQAPGEDVVGDVDGGVAEVGRGGLELYDGGFDEWTAWREARRAAVDPQLEQASPGEPSARNGVPSRSTIVGDIDERGRLPPSIRFGSSGL